MSSRRGLKLTPELMEKLYEARSRGASIQLACDYAGIHRWTWNDWMNRGEDHLAQMDELDMSEPAPDEAIFVEFRERMIQAKGECGVVKLKDIERAGRDNVWQASAWALQRMYPNDYDLPRVGTTADPTRHDEETEERPAEEVQEIIDVLREAGQLPAELFASSAEGDDSSTQ